jgi:predicted Fe-S protein YdhL (DUF1289 family)
MPWRRLTLRLTAGWVMSERERPEPHLFTYLEWCALSDEERAQVLAQRRAQVEQAKREHDARQRLNDALTVERFGRGTSDG